MWGEEEQVTTPSISPPGTRGNRGDPPPGPWGAEKELTEALQHNRGLPGCPVSPRGLPSRVHLAATLAPRLSLSSR